MRSLLLGAGIGAISLSLAGCGGGGGGGSGDTGGLRLAAVNGTWLIDQTVTGSTCSGASGGQFYVNIENTSGAVGTISTADGEVAGSFPVTINGRTVKFTGTGTDTGDSIELTLGSGDATLTGTTVDFDETVSPTCTTTYRVTGTKIASAPTVGTGDWTFTASWGSGATAVTRDFGAIALTQKFASVRGTGATSNFGCAWTGTTWTGNAASTGTVDLLASISGTFDAAGTQFTGTFDGTYGVLPVTGALTGTRNGSGGTSCTTADTSAVWDMVQTFNGSGTANYSGGTLTQTGCDLVFAYNGGTPFTLSGALNGSSWSALQGGTNAAPDRRYSATLSGSPATSLSGNFTNVATSSDFGTFTITKRTSSACGTANPGSWTLTFTSGPLNGLTFEAATLTQNACSITLAWTFQTFSSTWSGSVTGNTWSASLTGGNFFQQLGNTVSLSATLSGANATSAPGTYSASGANYNGSGSFTLTRN